MNELMTLNDSQSLSDVIKGGSEQDLQKLLGSEPIGPQSSLSRLSINYNTEDENDNTLPRGFYKIYDPESRNIIFAENVKFRPFVRTYLYRVWDNEEGQYSCRTVQCKNMGDPFYDTSGGEKCGKLDRKQIDSLANDSPVLIQQKNIKCVQAVYGLVDMEGKDATNEEYTLENVPALWEVKGASFIPVSDWLKSIDKEKKLYATVVGKLETVKQKRGGNQYWISRATNSGTKNFTKKDRETLEMFIGEILAYNSEILEKHAESKKAMDEGDVDLLETLDATAA